MGIVGCLGAAGLVGMCLLVLSVGWMHNATSKPAPSPDGLFCPPCALVEYEHDGVITADTAGRACFCDDHEQAYSLAHGGCDTLIDMALNDLARLARKRQAVTL